MKAVGGFAAGLFCVMTSATLVKADEPVQPEAYQVLPLGVADAQPVESESIPPQRHRGYQAYSYPALDSCPCRSGRCFSPWRYFCGGDDYRQAWFRKWLRAHFRHGSMLEDYPCECVRPAGLGAGK